MRELLEAKGIASDKIFIVNNYPDLTHFHICEVPAVWPKSDVLTLLYCGTITEHYDLGLAIRAMADLAGDIPIKLKIMGDGNRLSEVLELASALGVNDAIEVLGKVPIENVAAEMRRADVGISCHRAGVFGDLYFSTKIVEYMTQGLPVVSPRTYTISRYLPDDCIFYYEAGNVKALANTIRFMWNNPEVVLSRINKGRALLSQLSWQSEKKMFSAFYADLLKDR
jgi:glycosyltransferase involved in cell wall biosynthesis